jgi:hypothetical protein
LGRASEGLRFGDVDLRVNGFCFGLLLRKVQVVHMHETTMVDNAVRLAIPKNVYIVLLDDPKVVHEAEIWSVLDVVLPAVIGRNLDLVLLRSSEVVNVDESAIGVYLVLLAVIANDMDSVVLSPWLVVDKVHLVVLALLHPGLQALEHASVGVFVVDGHLVGLRY